MIRNNIDTTTSDNKWMDDNDTTGSEIFIIRHSILYEELSSISNFLQETENIKDVFHKINKLYHKKLQRIKQKFLINNIYIKRYRMDRLIGKREKRIGRKR